MAINTSWKILTGQVTAPIDLTNRVMGMSIDQQVDVNVIGSQSCTITLLNKDGAFTPGGGGTYSSTNWFQQPLRVSALTNIGGADTETNVFGGAITNFELVDDGVFSTVNITAIDFLSFSARSPSYSTGVSGNQTYTGRVTAFIESVPLYGATVRTTYLNNLGGYDTTCNRANATYGSLGDGLQIGTVPVANDVLWDLGMVNVTAYPSWDRHVNCIPMVTTRTTANRVDFEFVPVTSVTGTKFPFDDDTFGQGFDLPSLVTYAQCQAAVAGSTTQNSIASTYSTYGYRTQAFTAEFENDAAALAMAKKLTNRYGDARFTPVQLSISAKMLKQVASDSAHQKWYQLLSIDKGLWQKATITWTGSGASSQTADCVIKGRRIDVTPQDSVITLTLGNWTDNHAFILDQDQLDVDKLG